MRTLTQAIITVVLCTLASFSNSFAIEPEDQSGGDATVDEVGSLAFAKPAPNLTPDHLNIHLGGDAQFALQFSPLPPPAENGGLGPRFNNSSCVSCHTLDGRGLSLFGKGETGSQAIMRVSLQSGSTYEKEGATPVPEIGLQVRDHAIEGATPDGEVSLSWKELKPFKYPDGNTCKIRLPQVHMKLARGGRVSETVLTSMRIAPPVFGLGLIEAIPDQTILDLAASRKSGGVKGHINYVWDIEKNSVSIGRFGWKANTVNLIQQAAGAYFNDMGLSNPLHAERDGTSDVSRETVESVAYYPRSLGVPARRPLNTPELKKGEKVFHAINCVGCHRSTLVTGDNPIPEFSKQTIHPYTDLLVHDMGSVLADGRPDYGASGSEWRTAPLWGVGLTHVVNADATFLHDGRARTLEEAILWHEGEARTSRDAFVTQTASNRKALLAFLNAL